MSDGPVTSLDDLSGPVTSPDDHPAAGVPIPGELTPASVGLPNDPVTSGSNLVTEPGNPDLANHPAADVPAPNEFGRFLEQPGKNKAKADVSTKGITEHGKKEAGGIFGAADANISKFSAADAEDMRVMQQRADQHYGDLKAATGEEYNATKTYEAKNQDLEQKIADFNTHAANTEAQINQESIASRQAYMTDYKTQLAGVQRLAMQSGNPMNSLSAPAKVGLMGAQFAQGFLAARGINIDVSGQVDRWVDRSIQEHQAQIANARQGAADTLHLYDVSRQASADDSEARQRYRGFVIAGLQMGVQMNAARFQSDIGMAHAHEAISKLQIEADTTERSIGDAHQARVHSDMMAEYDRAYKQGQLSIESYRAAVEKAHYDAEERKAKAAGAADLTMISDPEAVKGEDGKDAYVDRWAIDAKANPKGAEHALESRAMTDKIYRQIDTVEKLRKVAYDKYGGLFGGAPVSERAAMMSSPEIRTYERERQNLIRGLRVENTGKAFTESETRDWERAVPDESAWQAGNNNVALPQLKEQVRNAFEAEMNTYAKYGRGQKASPHAAAEWQAIQSNGKPAQQLDDDIVSSYKTPAKYDKGTLLASVPADGKVPAKADPESLSTGEDLVQPSKAFSVMMGLGPDEQQPHGAVGVEILARTYLNPEHARRAFGHDKNLSMPDSDDLLRHQALSGIERMTNDSNPYVSGYAKIIEDKLKGDPAGLRELLMPEERPIVGNYHVERLP